MIKHWVGVTALFLCGSVAAQNLVGTKITPPRFLKPTDKVPQAHVTIPDVPDEGSDGNDLDSKNSIDPPGAGMDRLTKPALFEEIKKTKRLEKTAEKVYWHSSDGLDYCHYIDIEGNHWYGWDDDGNFHWVLWQGNRYWWKDELAGLWLYFDRGFWWRSDNPQPDQIQVRLNEEYYLCDKDGKILGDAGQDGQGLINSGTGRFQGDSHGGHGGHGGEQGGGRGQGGKPGGNAPAGGGVQAQ